MDQEGKLTFLADNRKSMYKQLADNLKVVICRYDGLGNTSRICRRRFPPSKETQEKPLEVVRSLKRGYTVGDSF